MSLTPTLMMLRQLKIIATVVPIAAVIVLEAIRYLMIGALPLGWYSYREHQRKDAEHAATQPLAVDAPGTPPLQPDEHNERPTHLN